MAITALRVEGLRTLADVRLDLRDLTVLIGENDNGKSSLIEACEVLRKAPRADFPKEFRRTHWGFAGLLRQGADHLTLGARVEEEGEIFDYEFTLANRERGIVVAREKLTAGPDRLRPAAVTVWHQTETAVLQGDPQTGAASM